MSFTGRSDRDRISAVLTAVMFLAELIVGAMIAGLVVHLLHPSYTAGEDGIWLHRAMRRYWPATIAVLLGSAATAVMLARLVKSL